MHDLNTHGSIFTYYPYVLYFIMRLYITFILFMLSKLLLKFDFMEYYN